MHRIIGNPVGVPNPKTNWNQTDENKADIILNKPTKLSDFDNDTGYVTQEELNEKLRNNVVVCTIFDAPENHPMFSIAHGLLGIDEIDHTLIYQLNLVNEDNKTHEYSDTISNIPVYKQTTTVEKTDRENYYKFTIEIPTGWEHYFDNMDSVTVELSNCSIYANISNPKLYKGDFTDRLYLDMEIYDFLPGNGFVTEGEQTIIACNGTYLVSIRDKDYLKHDGVMWNVVGRFTSGDSQIGDIAEALTKIKAIQNQWIGGDSE